MKYHFGVLGGGKRYQELARLLEQDGHAVYTYEPEEGRASLDRALSAEIVLLPIPLSPDGERISLPGQFGIGGILARLGPDQMILAGQVPHKWADAAAKRGLRLVDFLSREPVAVANAAATADAALALSLETTGETLLGKRCLVLGFGRIGKLLCRRLQGAGARVSAAARRKEDRAWIRALGYDALDIGRLRGKLMSFDEIYNTVPAPVLDADALGELRRGCLLVELASRPGICPEAAEALGMNLIKASGLPGRMVPRTAAKILREAVYDILREERGESI